MKPPRRFALTFLLALPSSTGPLSLDMYLPSLPDIGRSLEASTLQVQLTISSYLFGSAVGQIFYGPMSDRYGRRPLLLAALSLYALAAFGSPRRNLVRDAGDSRAPLTSPRAERCVPGICLLLRRGQEF